jgi:hypothetical protein
MTKIEVKNINLGGISNSDYQGSENSVSDCVNLDIHHNVGLIRLNHRMTKISESAMDDDVYTILSCSNGKKYFFGKTTGKIYEYNGTTITLKYTDSHLAIYDAIEYNGYLYWATKKYLQRILISDVTATWTVEVDNEWATFTNESTEHPMYQLNLVLYIGDGSYVSVLEKEVFTAKGLDVPVVETILTIGENLGNELLIGSIVGSSGYGFIRRWNTWSLTYTSEDIVKSGGVYAMLDVDNATCALAGKNGDIAQYVSDVLTNIKTIKGDFLDNTLQSNHRATSNLRGLSLFGLYGGTANINGIWSYGSIFARYAKIINTEFTLSNGKVSGFQDMKISKDVDSIYCSWKHYDPVTMTTTYGIDKYINTQYQDEGYFITRIIEVDRTKLSKFGKASVAYESLPTGTSIEIWKKVNNGSWEQLNTVIDTDRKIVESEVSIENATTLQIKSVLKTNTAKTSTPEVESLAINI